MTPIDSATEKMLITKLSQIAQALPNYEIEDLRRLNILVAEDAFVHQVQDHLFTAIDADDQRLLVSFGSACLENDFVYLANLFLQYCLTFNVVSGEVLQKNALAKTIIAIISRYELSHYIDVERGSHRVKIFYDGHYFTIHFTRISEVHRIKILELLYKTCVNAILENSRNAEVFIIKYNNILSLIRELGHMQLQKTRWARLFISPDLKYSPNASHTLFHSAIGPFNFDEAIRNNFNIILLPSFGEISFDGNRISIANEGNGSIKDPKIRIVSNGKLLVETKVIGVISAGEQFTVELTMRDIRNLSILDPNIQTVNFHLLFEKFESREFDFVRPVKTTDILDWIKSLDVSPIAIHNAAELFEVVKGFVKDIKHKVQEDDGYITITEEVDGERNLRSESEIQVGLKHWFAPMCESQGIDLNREPLTGRGPLDFKFSIGSAAKCLMEVKLWHSSKLNHGGEIQLPTYMISEKATYGIYVPIAVNPESHQEKLLELQNCVRESSEQHHLEIIVMDIQAWKLESASKTKTVSDRELY